MRSAPVGRRRRGFFYREEAEARRSEIALTRVKMPYLPPVSRY
jgi:hypothetical protein